MRKNTPLLFQTMGFQIWTLLPTDQLKKHINRKELKEFYKDNVDELTVKVFSKTCHPIGFGS